MKKQLRYYITIMLCIALLGLLGSSPYEDYLAYSKKHGSSPTYYLLDKTRANNLLLIGTHHKDSTIHNIIIEALPELVRQAKINTLFVEIQSSEQEIIELFMYGAIPVKTIELWNVIESRSYCAILDKARDLDLNIVAIDKPMPVKCSRDQWMASRITNHFSSHPDTKGIVIVGERHVLKNVSWNCDSSPSLADYLADYNAFSVVMWPDAINMSCPKALDIIPAVFAGIKDSTIKALNVKQHTSLATSADGIILLPNLNNNM